MTIAIIGFIVFLVGLSYLIYSESKKYKETKEENESNEVIYSDYKNYSTQQIDLDMFQALNEYRLENNLNSLIMIPSLCSIAFSNSERLAEFNYTKKQLPAFAHKGFYTRSQNYPTKKFLENVSYNYKTGKGAINAFKLSKIHNANCLDKDIVYIGIATAKGVNGKTYTTFNFLAQ